MNGNRVWVAFDAHPAGLGSTEHAIKDTAPFSTSANDYICIQCTAWYGDGASFLGGKCAQELSDDIVLAIERGIEFTLFAKLLHDEAFKVRKIDIGIG